MKQKQPILLVGNFLSGHCGVRQLSEDLADRLGTFNWPVTRTSSKVGRISRVADMVTTAWLKRHQYALAQVDVFTGSAFIWAEAVCRTLRIIGKPYVLTLRGGDFPSFAQRRGRRVRNLLQSAVAVTVPSRYLLREMKPYRTDLTLLPNALELPAYTFRLRSRPQPQLIWLRAFHEIYNPTLAARVIAQLTPQFPDIRLTMVGRDKSDGSLQATRRMAQQLGVSDRIVFTGGVPKASVPACLSQADIFINTTNIDNTPVSVLEAMASGLCVVSTNVGGMPDLVNDQQNGLLVPPNDAKAMATAVRRVLSEPMLAEQLSLNARDSVEQFAWSRVLSEWDQLFTTLLAADRCHGR